jgi:hypothetical protein
MSRASANETPLHIITVRSILSEAVDITPCLIDINRAIVKIKCAIITAQITPKNLPKMNKNRGIGLDKVVIIVFVSNSSVIAVDAEKIDMNNPAINSVDSPISRKSLLSSSSEYIVSDGLKMNKNTAAAMITAYTGCRIISTKVFFAIE